MNNMRRRHRCVLIALTFGAIAWFFIMKGGNGFMRTATHPEPTGKQIRELNNFKHLKHQMDYDYDFALAKERGAFARRLTGRTRAISSSKGNTIGPCRSI